MIGTSGCRQAAHLGGFPGDEELVQRKISGARRWSRSVKRVRCVLGQASLVGSLLSICSTKKRFALTLPAVAGRHNLVLFAAEFVSGRTAGGCKARSMRKNAGRHTRAP